jgi:proline iminopeptidase
MLESCRDLEAIRAALFIDKWAFAGHSTGGMLGLVYAINFNRSLTKIIVGGASATKEYMNHDASMYSARSPLNERLKELFSVIKSAESTKEQRSKAGREWTEMSLYHPGKFDEYFSKPSSGKVVAKRLDYYSFKELPHYDIAEKLSDVSIPSYIFCGRYDAQCPLTFSEEIHTQLRDSQLIIFEESNHIPFLEEKTVFNQMVVEFQKIV